MNSINALRERLGLCCLVSTMTVLAFQPLTAQALQGVEVTGSTTEYSDQATGGSGFMISKDELCSMEGSMLVFETMDMLKSRLGSRFGSMGLPLPEYDDVAEGMNELCKEDEEFSSNVFTVFYTECRMTMDSAGQMLDIVLPRGDAEGRMDVVDFMNSEGMRVKLRRDLAATNFVTGKGWGSNVSMTPMGSGGEIAGYDTTKYQFSYSGGMGGGNAVPGAEMITTTSAGTAWIAENVDGIEIVHAFYKNMSTEVDSTQGAGSFMSGLINSQVSMLERGMPLKSDQTVDSKVAGMSMAFGRSEMEVYTVEKVNLPNDWCEQNFVPPGIVMKDVQQEIADAMSGNGGSNGANAEAAAAMSDAQRQYNEAMKSLTPEQQEMMKKMGMGDMQQLMGGAAPASAATAGAAASAAASQGSPAARSAPASSPDPYYSDNVTQMVQRQLKALGYDPGNTDGVDSMETSIAISQFQAENKMKVTGKASPQLAGVLSAKLEGN